MVCPEGATDRFPDGNHAPDANESHLQERAMSLKNSKTEANLKDAFAGESQANRRYLYFAQKADIEGYNDVAAVFRSTAEGERSEEHTSELQSLLRISYAAFCLQKKPT